jgi:hypothetical protein
VVAFSRLSEYWLVIHDSIAGGMCFGYGDDFRRAVHNYERRYETSWSLQSLTISAVVAAFGVDESTEFGLFVVAFSRLRSKRRGPLVILDFIGDGIYCGYEVLFATVDARTRNADPQEVKDEIRDPKF